MGPLAHTGVVGVLLVVLAVLVAVLLVVVPATLLVRSARARRARVTAQLEESRAEVALLGRRVEELSQEVLEARRLAPERSDERAPDRAQDRSTVREYVITSLAAGAAGAAPRPVATGAEKVPLGRVLEDQLVGSLARQQDRSALRRQVVEAVVRTVSLGHGLRRALTPDNLDRAAAEAHVARRRSRRIRRRELKEARRLLRVVPPHPHDEDVA
jgi:type II secretory pathway component PulM